LHEQESKVNACNSSGGMYDKATSACTCPSGMTLDSSLVRCLGTASAVGPLGGDMVAACNQSGGSYDTKASHCTCPAGMDLDDTKAKCLGPDGAVEKAPVETAPLGGDMMAACNQSGGDYNTKTAKCACPAGKKVSAASGKCP
jgi:hypothetical protein